MLERIYDVSELKTVAHTLNKLIAKGSTVVFVGSLGAGKTTLIKALLADRGVTDVVTSPTFSYVHAYTSAQGEQFFHFDLYRLDTLDQFVTAGFDEYLEETDKTILIEWPDIIKPLISARPYIEITLEYAGEKRKIMVKQHGGKTDTC